MTKAKLAVLRDREEISDPEYRILDHFSEYFSIDYQNIALPTYDLYYSFSPFIEGYRALIYLLTGKSVLYAPHCLGFHDQQSLFKNKIKFLLLRLADFFPNLYIRSISKWEYGKYEAAGISKSKLYYIPLSIDFKSLSEIQPEWGSRNIFSIANSRRFKDIETQIRAIDSLVNYKKNVSFHIIGGWQSEDYRQEIEDIIEELCLGDKITIHGFVSREKMFEIMSKCEVFIHTSQFETQGLAIYEAAAAGFPICVSDVPAHNQNFERFKHPQGDHEALAEDIKTIFEMDKEEKEEISEEMRKLAKYFSYEKEIERLNELFEELDIDE